MKAFTLIILLCISLFSCTIEQEKTEASYFADPVLVEIYENADHRETAKLITYATHENAEYRMAFARIMGSVQDTAALEMLHELLLDPIPYVRLYAAFAVGQTATEKSLPALEKSFKKESIPEIKAELLQAIGKCANDQALEFLLFHDPNTAVEEAGKLWGVYQAMLKGLLKKEHIPTIAAHLESGESDTRLAAAHILARQDKVGLEEECNRLSSLSNTDPSAEVRIAVTLALRHCSSAGSVLASLAKTDADPRVRAAALRILPLSALEKPSDYLFESMEQPSVWEAMTAAFRFRSIPSPILKPEMQSLARYSAVPEVRAVLIETLLQHPETRERGRELYNEIWKQYPNPIEQGVLLSIWSSFPFGMDTLRNYLRSGVPALSTSAAEAFISGARTFPAWRQELSKVANEVFSQAQSGAIAITASAMREGTLRSSFEISKEELIQALERFSLPGEVEVRNELRKTLNEVYGEGYPIEPPEYNQPIDWPYVASLGKQVAVRLYSDGRSFEFVLLPEDAPGTVSNFLKLVENRFYDGTYFHRIVPVFVTQGGGSTGDGYGSTDYTIRSEFSPLQYGTGVLGMASAGKDTEGSQFFITHCPAPHLDGRYSIFGAVSEGFEEMDQIHTGSRIDSIRIAEATP